MLAGARRPAGPRPVSVESLAEALWSDTSHRRQAREDRSRRTWCACDPSSAGHRDRDRSVTATGSAAGLETDVERFERAVRPTPQQRPAVGSRVAMGRGAWRGRGDAPLEDLRHWAPADGRRAQLEELRLSAIEARWEAALDEGRAGRPRRRPRGARRGASRCASDAGRCSLAAYERAWPPGRRASWRSSARVPDTGARARRVARDRSSSQPTRRCIRGRRHGSRRHARGPRPS